MKRSKFTESQILFALNQAELGVKVEEVCRKLGISEATFYNWKKKCAGLGVTELLLLRQLEEKNIKLKKIVADLSLDKQILQDVLKKALTPYQLKLVRGLIEEYRVSIRKACQIIMLRRSVWYYRKKNKDDSIIRMRMKEKAMVRVRYGFWRIFTLLRREGFRDNHKRVYRIYRLEGLNLRSKRHHHSRSWEHRLERITLEKVNQCWSMDFVSDQLSDGRRFRVLTVIDNYSKKCHALEVGQSLKVSDVVRVLDRVKFKYGALPERIQMDNGSEFISKDLDKWAYENHVTLDYSRPGRPTDNAFIESFNGSLRDECLNTNWFLSLSDARDKLECWLRDYNTYRPHSSLQGLTPDEVDSQMSKKPEFSTLEWP
ncbi:MAG: IS3 family transposase [Bacteroidales bacterium]|nr:IS3 family transposase [Bacteroidales bacterium]